MTDSHHVKKPKAKRASGNKISNNLVAVSSAAVFSVYMAGYLRTSAAADRLEVASSQRRPSAPVQVEAPQRPGRSDASVNAESPKQAGRSTVETAKAAATVPMPARAPASLAPPVTANRTVSTAVTEKTVPNHDAAPAVTAAAAPPTSTPVAPTPAAAPVAVAPEAVAASATPAAAAKYKDGTFTGWGTSRHGDIEAQVVIEGGRIVSATISQCYTRYPCTYISPLPPQVVQRQSPEIDFVSRATDSTNAFYYGLVQALAKAKPPNEP